MNDLTRSEQILVARAYRLRRELPGREPVYLLLAIRPDLSDADCERLAPAFAAKADQFRRLAERNKALEAKEPPDQRKHRDQSKPPGGGKRRVIRKGEFPGQEI